MRAIESWERAVWPEGAETLLKRAFEIEPYEETREMIRKALAGEPMGF